MPLGYTETAFGIHTQPLRCYRQHKLSQQKWVYQKEVCFATLQSPLFFNGRKTRINATAGHSHSAKVTIWHTPRERSINISTNWDLAEKRQFPKDWPLALHTLAQQYPRSRCCPFHRCRYAECSATLRFARLARSERFRARKEQLT